MLRSKGNLLSNTMCHKLPSKLTYIVACLLMLSSAWGQEAPKNLKYQSAYLSIEVSPDQPAFVSLELDSLGKKKLGPNPLRAPEASGKKYQIENEESKFAYRADGTPATVAPAWVFEFSERRIHLRSTYSPQNPPPALVLNFNTHLNHATLLGLMNDAGNVRLPALLHMPDQGTLRITSGAAQEVVLGYEAERFHKPRQSEDYVKITFPPGSAATQVMDYTLDVVAIYPGSSELAQDPRFDGFRRNWLTMF